MRKLRTEGSKPQPHKHLQAELGTILLAWPRRETSSGHNPQGKQASSVKKKPKEKPQTLQHNIFISSASLLWPPNRSENPLEISTQAHSELPFLSYANDSQSKAAC